jgi:hypothetical protein
MKIKHRLTPTLLIALLAFFVALGGVGSAANGDKLILGQSNSATSQTSLSAPVVGGKALQVTNTSTNSGSTALGLSVASGHAPLTVNSSTKVANLNADLLDGLDSSGFWKLGGNAVGSTGALGTTTNEPLVLKVNGQRALRLEPTATSPNLIGGFYANAAQNGADGATIAGGGENGYPNFVSDTFGTVGGGESNRAGSPDGNPQTAPYATVAGGKNNTAGGYSSTVGGGDKNTSNAPFSTVAGGASNTAGNTEATVGGGDSNTAVGFKATIAGGAYNTASGSHSAVPGGLGNAAGGEGSFAAGFSAQAIYDHSFVWSDGNFSSSIASPAADSFTAHATGGFNLWTNSSGSATGCGIYAGGGTWVCSSSRSVKDDFAPIDRAQMLKRLARIPITTWHYRTEEAGVRHIGPMAQDFARAFHFGQGTTGIAMVDADGVSLAAIQGLYRQNRALAGRVTILQRQNRTLSSRLANLEQAVAKLSH